MGAGPITFRREVLYDEVWAEPVGAVAKRYGVSSYAFAKVCKQLCVPIPERGYWSKKRVGKAPDRTPLPVLPKDAPAELSLEREKPQQTTLPEPKSAPAEPVAPSAPPTPEAPHRLVAKASKLLHRRNVSKTDKGGLVYCRREKCLNIQVSPEQLDRALALMDAILKALEERKYRVEITEVASYDASYNRIGDKDVEPNATRILVDEEWLSFGIVERLTTVEPTPPAGGPELERWKIYHPKRVYVPKGILQLALTNSQISGRFVWEDGKERRLESRVADFVARLPEAAQAIKAQRAQAERWRLEAEERQRREREAQSRRWKEEQRVKDFQALLDRWRLARDCRAYVAEARRVVVEAGCVIMPGSEFEKSLDWALRYADRVDPLSELRIDAVSQLRGAPREQDPQEGEHGPEGGEDPGETDE